MKISFHEAALVATLVAAGAVLQVAGMAQASHTVNGRWQGVLQNLDVKLIVDLTKNQKGEWVGTFSIPDIEVTDVPLTQLVVGESGIRFTISGVPGTPAFEGKLSADGKGLSGTLSSGGQKSPLSLNRIGEAKVALPKPNSALSKSFEGAWQGTLEWGGAGKFHLVLKLARGADGRATGTLTDIDEGNKESPLTSVVQEGDHLQFEVRALSQTYRGTLNAAGTGIEGEWTQMGRKAPLKFQRGTSAKANSQLTKAFEGTWRGTIDQGGEYKIELIVKLAAAADGTATGTLKTGEANSRQVPLSAIIQKGMNLQFEVDQLKANYKGTLNSAGTAITGTWGQQQILEGLSLTFKRQAGAAKKP